MRVTLPPQDGDAAAYDWGGGDAQAPVKQRPDLVAVLEESTLDPRSWADCTSPRCRFDLFGADDYTRAHGLLRVHTYGGGTWTSEFAFLAGLPHTLFGPAGLYAPYNLAPRLRESLPRRLKALGYRTVAVYPMPRRFVRAAEAYAEYGFDEFHDARELGIEWETTDLQLVDKVEEIHRRLRAEDDRPLFLMQAFTLAGSVVSLRKQGDNRAFVTVEDGSGKFEAVLYRETWIEFGPLLTRDAILVFEGGLSIDDFSGGYQLRVQNVATLEAACERRARVLRLRLNGVDGAFIARLHGALAGHRGGHTLVRVSYRNATGQAEIELGNEWRVRANPALADALQALDGVIAAEIVFG